MIKLVTFVRRNRSIVFLFFVFFLLFNFFIPVFTKTALAVSPDELNVISADDVSIRVISRYRMEVTLPETRVFNSGPDDVTFQELFGGIYEDSNGRDGADGWRFTHQDTASFLDQFDDSALDIGNEPLSNGASLGSPEFSLPKIEGFFQPMELTLVTPFGGDVLVLTENGGWFEPPLVGNIDFTTGLHVFNSTTQIANFDISYAYNGEVIIDLLSPDDTYVPCPNDTFAHEGCATGTGDDDRYIEVNAESLIGDLTVRGSLRRDGRDWFITIAQSEHGASINIPGSGSVTTPTCESSQGGLGWIVCAVVEWFVARLDDFVGQTSEDLLFVQVDDSPDSQLHKAWQSFVTIANIFFVIAFIVVVFGQATSIGVDAYTVKKMLPRIVVGIIAVQLSFFLVQILIDFSNVLGRGVDGIMTAAVGEQVSVINGSIFGGGFTGSLGNLLATGAIVYIALATLPTILLGLLAVYFTLIIRLALLALLVVVAPLAFVAWILPNTEFAFKKWSSMFIKLLLMFPLIILLLSAGKLAGSLLVNEGLTEASEANLAGPITAIASIVLNAAPYFLIPFTFKLAGAGMAAVASAVNQAGTKAIRDKEGRLKGAARVGEFRQRTAAGATRLGGSRLARRLASPMSFISPRRERARAVAGVASMAKEMQDSNLDGESAMAIGMSGGWDGDYQTGRGAGEFGDYIEELRGFGMHDMAQRLIAARNDPANSRWRDTSAGQQAALLIAAQKGHINGNMMRSIQDHQGWSPQDRISMQSRLAGAAHAAGRFDVASGFAASGDHAQLDAYTRRLSSEELKHTARDASEPVAQSIFRNLLNPAGATPEEQAASREETIIQLRDLMNERAGSDPELRRHLEAQLEDLTTGTPAEQVLAQRIHDRITQFNDTLPNVPAPPEPQDDPRRNRGYL